jgi:asparagine synthase (glutamine-hydrolysing)
MSFSSWPATNALDLDVLRTCLALPGKWMIGRQAQKELVIRRFPDLAALPLDRNSFDASPLVGGGNRRLASLTGRIRRKMKALTGWESRYYFRAYDLDARQWKAIRTRAEPHRDLVGSIFRRDALRELLPAPRSPVKYMSDRIGHSGPLKLLVGLMMLADPSLAGGLSGFELYPGD